MQEIVGDKAQSVLGFYDGYLSPLFTSILPALGKGMLSLLFQAVSYYESFKLFWKADF